MSNQEEYTIDLLKILNIVKKNALMFLLIIVFCGAACFGGTIMLIPKTYSATATVVIVSNEDANQGITYNDVQLSQKLTATYSRILMSETVGEQVIKNLKLTGWTSETYKNAVNVSSTNNTEVLDVTVTTQDPNLSEKIANETVNVFSNEVYNIMNVRNVTILDKAKVPTEPSGPNLKRNTGLGLAVGIMICALIALLKSFKDTKMKTEEEVKNALGYPIVGAIPDIAVTGKRRKNYA